MITTHVLDTSRGKPAAGVVVRLERGAAVLLRVPKAPAAVQESPAEDRELIAA